ncbi:hypothetical protein [Pseudonocardia nigra]|uniref:hypothetical protein n=1 Tax=Pseudonocardia nigra TaxID=1921578 RepID=UPI001C5DBB07|nr:hypothetical protein [Pseudonocardia nigra]
MRWGTATALLAITSALSGALAVGVPAPASAREEPPATWSPDLAAGDAVGVTVDGGTARLDPAAAFPAPAGEGRSTEAEAEAEPMGLLTLPVRELTTPTDRIGAAVTGDVPPGATATVDVRGRRATGGWSEWVPAIGGAEGSAAVLPEPASDVQGRLVLTGSDAAAPAVRGVTFTALPPTAPLAESGAEQVLPLSYRVFATREGLVGRTTANGHVIGPRDHFVALPSRRALSPRGTSDYSVKVCAPNGRCAFAPVWDVGPWNTRDDYWNPPHQRREWRDLPQGLPQAQAAKENGYNRGRDQYGRKVANPAGIDLADGLFWDALGLQKNSWVQVDYLWTGLLRLSKVGAEQPLRAAPDAEAEVVGVAAEGAAVPVECALGSGEERWLRVGVDQYLPATAVRDVGKVDDCAPEGAPQDTGEDTDEDTGTPANAAEDAG